jgi:hypothetical protein
MPGTSDNEAMAMTEQEWLACNDPQPMLSYLDTGRVNGRKLQLFLCACCQAMWHLLTDDRSQKAVVAAERYVDGFLSDDELENAWGAAISAAVALKGHIAGSTLEGHVAVLAANSVYHRHWFASVALGRSLYSPEVVNHLEATGMNAKRSNLLRDIFGNPFRPVALNPACRTSNVTALAQSIYDDRAFDRMPILADALEDAGCDNADILKHCRQPGEHVRGCWVVDLVLEKE